MGRRTGEGRGVAGALAGDGVEGEAGGAGRRLHALAERLSGGVAELTEEALQPNGAEPATGSAPEASGEGDEGQASRTATLEAPPDAVEKVALASELGKLALSLRSLAISGPDQNSERSSRLTWDTEASPALRPENQQRTTLTVMRGDKVEAINIRRGAGS